MRNIPLGQFVLSIIITTIWFIPNLLSKTGLELAVSLLAGFLLAQGFIIIIRSCLVHYGANKYGVIALAGITSLLAIALGIYAWDHEQFYLLNIMWILLYTSVGVLHAAYHHRTKILMREVFLYAEYAFIALFVAALFNSYIEVSPIGNYNIEHFGVPAETIWFIAMAILLLDFSYRLYLSLEKRVQSAWKKFKRK